MRFLDTSLESARIKPFLKWAGGKRWLTNNFQHILPQKFNKYLEPFLGSGAVFFHLKPSSAILGDKNIELIETYATIQSDWDGVWKKLKAHQRNHSYNYYYKIRESSPKNPITRASRFIYLNRTCFNGLYRVNKNGKFNVPKGTKDKVVFADDNFELISNTLKNCKLISGDFEELVSFAADGDLLYVDPPYTVKHNNNNFIKYNETIFSWKDQLRLAESLYKAKNKGVKIIVSNADSISIRNLYKDFGRITKLKRASILAANSINRHTTTELLISNNV